MQAAPLASGIDTSAFDLAVRVQDDFHGHINGRFALGGKPSPEIDGLSGEQRLYIGFGIKYRSLPPEQRVIMW